MGCSMFPPLTPEEAACQVRQTVQPSGSPGLLLWVRHGGSGVCGGGGGSLLTAIFFYSFKVSFVCFSCFDVFLFFNHVKEIWPNFFFFPFLLKLAFCSHWFVQSWLGICLFAQSRCASGAAVPNCHKCSLNSDGNKATKRWQDVALCSYTFAKCGDFFSSMKWHDKIFSNI